MNKQHSNSPHWGEQIEDLQARLNESQTELARVRARLALVSEVQYWQDLRARIAGRLRGLCQELVQDSVAAATNPETGEILFHQCLRPVEEIEADIQAIAWWLESCNVAIPVDWPASSLSQACGATESTTTNVST
jgi:hypothetical protein